MSKMIILIDDDEDDLDIMKDVVRAVDPTLVCHSYMYPDEALDKLLTMEAKPDFVFIDMNMPLISGPACLQTLRSKPEFHNVRIIMYSTSMPGLVSSSLLENGADFVFEKPIQFERYIQVVRSIVQGERLCNIKQKKIILRK